MTDKMLNVLLVEDDAVDVMNVRRAFEKANIANPLQVAHDGIEALEVLQGDTVSRERLLVLLDLKMPRMDGIEFLKELRGDPALANIPVVVLTTSDAEQDRIQAYDLNVAGYIVKPVGFGNFVDAMVRLNKYWMLVEMP